MSSHRNRPFDEPVCRQARKQLLQLAYPQTGLREFDKQFYPRRALRQAFNTDVICQILNCSCTSCGGDLAFLDRSYYEGPSGATKRSQLATDITGDGTSRTKGAVALFALVLSVEHPLLILPFIEQQRDDVNLLESWCRIATRSSQQDDLERIWREYRPPDSSDIRHIARSFLENMHRFMPPVLSDGYSQHNNNTIMPFYDQSRIGYGASGDVYGFKIHPDYAKFSSTSNVTHFARKQLRGRTNIQTFYNERNNLDLVNHLKDRHIVQIVMSYRLGDDFNIVFPRAKANLFDCLTKPEHDLGRLTTGPLRRAQMWQQMVGLARALDNIINYDPQSNSQEMVYQEQVNLNQRVDDQILGYHFDLKPANILVYDHDQGEENFLKISDFGQAKFRNNWGDSRTTNPGGTETYAAPEASVDEDDKLNTRYDVWSLGCIFTELVTFLLRSYPGVEEFRQRRGKRVGRAINWCYFDKESVGRSYRFILRPEVKTWIDDLLQPQDGIPPGDNTFLEDVKTFLLGMLEVDVEKRYSSSKVYQELERILDREETGSMEYNSPDVPQSPLPEYTANGQGLGALDNFFARPSASPQSEFLHARLHLLDNSDSLKLRTTIRHRPEVHSHENRSEVLFVPKYAIRKGYHQLPTDWDFRLVTKRKPNVTAFGFEYKCSFIPDLRILQSVLTGNEVVKSFELSGLEYTLYEHWLPKGGKKLEQRLHRFLDKTMKLRNTNSGAVPNNVVSIPGEDEDDPPPYTMQMWREYEVPAPQEELQTNNGRRAPRQPTRVAPIPACRLVIFKSKQIIIIPFSKATRIEKSDDQTQSNNARIVPTGKRDRPSISASRLVSDQNPLRDLPAIPLDLSELRHREHTGGMELNFCNLTFRKPQDANSFREGYLELKKAWRAALDASEA